MDVELIMRRVETDLDRARSELSAAQARVDELSTVLTGLRVAVERYGLSMSPAASTAAEQEPPVPHVDNDWTRMQRMDACERVVMEAGRAVQTGDVRELLLAHGRQDEYDQVRASLGYLQRIGRIKRVSRGLWAPITDSEASEASAMTEVSDDPITTSEVGGESFAAPKVDQDRHHSNNGGHDDLDRGTSVAELRR